MRNKARPVKREQDGLASSSLKKSPLRKGVLLLIFFFLSVDAKGQIGRTESNHSRQQQDEADEPQPAFKNQTQSDDDQAEYDTDGAVDTSDILFHSDTPFLI